MGGGGRPGGRRWKGREEAGTGPRHPIPEVGTDQTPTPGWAREPPYRRPGSDRTQGRPGTGPGRGTRGGRWGINMEEDAPGRSTRCATTRVNGSGASTPAGRSTPPPWPMTRSSTSGDSTASSGRWILPPPPPAMDLPDPGQPGAFPSRPRCRRRTEPGDAGTLPDRSRPGGRESHPRTRLHRAHADPGGDNPLLRVHRRDRLCPGGPAGGAREGGGPAVPGYRPAERTPGPSASVTA